MSDDEPPAPHDELTPPAAPEPSADIPSAVELVVPAAAYEAIATDEGLDEVLEEQGQLPGAPGKVLEAVQALAETLNRRFDQLQTLFEREIRAETTREKIVDRLHAELQDYKQDLLLKVLRPVFLDLIQLHDDLGKMAEAALADGIDDQRRWSESLHGFQQGVEDILYRQGVEPFAEEGDVFDPRRQRAVTTVPTDDPSRNKTIAARLRKGFQSGDKVIRPEVVSVYAFKDHS